MYELLKTDGLAKRGRLHTVHGVIETPVSVSYTHLYGATQGLFAIETAVNELAEKLHMDPMKLREMNIVKEGQVMPAFYGETNTSCALDRCIAKVKEMSHWDENYPCLLYTSRCV